MTVAKSAVRKTVSATARLACATAGQAARFTTLAGHESVPTPATRDSATVQSPPVMCYK
jgi:hypothetical protein